MTKRRITVQVLNGATGEIREVVANVTATDDQHAADSLFSHARTDDYYYRFLGSDGVIEPSVANKNSTSYYDQTYWELVR